MLKIKHVNKSYQDQVVLNDISYTFSNAGFYSIIGDSGTGKTTLLNLLSTIDTPSGGEITYQDTNIYQIQNYLRDYVSLVFQEYNLIPTLTVYDNIALGITNLNESDEVRIHEYLTRVSLEAIANKKVNDLSGGQKQRVAIIRALIRNTKVIFCDEPTGALDSRFSKVVFQFLKEISQDVLVIVATHNEQLARNYSDVILRVKDGKLEEQIMNEPKCLAQTELLEVTPQKKQIHNHHLRKITQKVVRMNLGKTFLFLTLLFIFQMLFLLFMTLSLYSERLDDKATMKRYNIQYVELRYTGKDSIQTNIGDKKEFEQVRKTKQSHFYDYIKRMSQLANIHNEEIITTTPKLYYTNEMEKSEIIITDYLYDKLYGNDATERSVKIEGIKLNIKGIIETNYQIIENAELFEKFLNEQYLICFVHEDVALDIIIHDEIELRFDMNQRSPYHLKLKHLDIYNEVVLGVNEVLISNRMMMELSIQIGSNTQFRIDRIKYGDANILTSKNVVGSIEEESIVLNYYENKNFILELYKEQNAALYQVDEHYQVLKKQFSIISMITYEGMHQELIQNLKPVIIMIGTATTICMLLFSIDFYRYIIRKEKKNIYILVSLGYPRGKVIIYYMRVLFINLLITSLISMVGIILFHLKVNQNNMMMLKFYWFQFQYGYLGLLAAISLLILMVVIYFMVRKKESLSQTIKIS